MLCVCLNPRRINWLKPVRTLAAVHQRNASVLLYFDRFQSPCSRCCACGPSRLLLVPEVEDLRAPAVEWIVFVNSAPMCAGWVSFPSPCPRMQNELQCQFTHLIFLAGGVWSFPLTRRHLSA